MLYVKIVYLRYKIIFYDFSKIYGFINFRERIK